MYPSLVEYMYNHGAHLSLSEWDMVQAIGVHILYWFSDHRVNIGYNYSSTWESYFLTINVNDCRGFEKRFKLIEYLKVIPSDIIYLQETHSLEQDDFFWKRAWTRG